MAELENNIFAYNTGGGALAGVSETTFNEIVGEVPTKSQDPGSFAATP